MYFPTNRKNELRLVRGSTQMLQIRVWDAQGKPYQKLDGDVIRFGVKPDGEFGRYLLKKDTGELEEGLATITLQPEDTIGMEIGKYHFDIGLQSEGMYFPIVKYSEFILEPNITAKE